MENILSSLIIFWLSKTAKDPSIILKSLLNQAAGVQLGDIFEYTSLLSGEYK